MIILEGGDGTGKSTLAGALVQATTLNLRKCNRPQDGLKHYVDLLQGNLQHDVWDRFHLGETVYPLLKRLDRRVPLSPAQRYMLELRLINLGALLVLCDTSLSNIAETFRVRGEDYVALEEVPRLSCLFQQAYIQSTLPKMEYNYATTGLDQAVREIIDRHAEIQWPANRLSEEASGHLNRPDVMLVGDQINPKEVYHRSVAFLHEAGCSLYLAKALYENFRERGTRYYLTNALKRGEPPSQVLLEHEAIQPKRVIAMGAVASKQLKALGIHHERTYHPQHWYRFQHHKFDEFKKALL